jgi:dTDP-3-amino-3,4,6-trideoxy-alpha-D-glucose transaminase
MQALTIPFGDLKREYAALRHEIDAGVQRVLSRGRFILGPEGESFESEFAAWLGARHAVGCASGTEAICLALAALGIGRGDDVLVPANTCVPTAVGVSMTGARPVPVDIDPRTLTIDSGAARRAATPRTRAIVAVHLYGAPADLGALAGLGLPIVEDCAQSHGATYRGAKTGTIGAIGCFSFYPSKNLGAYGDGGAVVTSDDALAGKLRMLRNYGQENRYVHQCAGLNSRLDELQAAILRVKLPHVARWNERRSSLARHYGSELRSVEIPEVVEGGASVHHLYPVLTDRREAFMDHLARAGVETLIHYPVPLHLQPCHRDWGFGPGSFPAAERAASRVVSLPLHPWMTDEEAAHVVAAVRSFHG